MIKELHKYVDFEQDKMSADVYCKYDSVTKEVLVENVVFFYRKENTLGEVTKR